VTAEEQRAFGQRVAFLRKKLGYSQAEFAHRIERSETWLSQVERGVRKIDRMSVLERLADGLGVSVTKLAPEREVVAAVAARSRPSTAGALTMTLVANDALRALLTEPAPAATADLESRSLAAWDYTHGVQYERLTDLLVELIPDVEVAERRAPEEERVRVRRVKARTYLAAAGALTELGEIGAAWVAIDRAGYAAEQIGDPLLIAETAFRLSITFQAAARFDLAMHVAASAAEALAGRTAAADADVAAVALYGALHLQLAVAASRLGDADSAYAFLETARAAGERVGSGRNDYDTEFGPDNVLLHEVAAAVELGDAGRALRAAERAQAGGLSTERQGRLLVDVARAHAQLRHTDEVIRALSDGAAIAPELYAAHPRVRELVANLVRGSSDRPDVRALAEVVQPTD
jgi:transcriptional regulator with XRE-family HTH domain